MKKNLKIYNDKLNDREFYYNCIKGMTNVLEAEIPSAELDDDDVYIAGQMIEREIWNMFVGNKPNTSIQLVLVAMMVKYYDNVEKLRDFEKAEYALLEEYNYPVPKISSFSFS